MTDPPPLAADAIEARWRRAGHLLRDHWDIVCERPRVEPPGWVTAHGWHAFLGSLPEGALVACEDDGLAAHAAALGAPADLRAMLAEAEAVCALPPLGPPDVDPEGAPTRRVSLRKRAQLAAFAAALLHRRPAARRIVDVGAGHGHLTRHLADALRVEALGLELDPVRVATARALAGDRARFEAVDVFADGSTDAVTSDDLLVGLHACGALTDRLVARAAEVGAAVAFASCCLQKRPEPARAPLVPGGPLADVPLTRDRLGLANISVGPHGIEVSLRANIAARARRAGILALLRSRGLDLESGDALRGLNRRRSQDPFPDLAVRVLAHRGLDPPTAAELRRFEAIGRADYGRTRRWSIARQPLGRVLEIQINCDRALYLVRRGYRAALARLWPLAISPRNVGVIAAPR